MRTAHEIQMEIETLPQQEYMKLVQWFSERDWKTWDQELIKDSQSGNLDFLIDEAIDAKNNGQLQDIALSSLHN
ncbi:MAG: hypothetical protein KAI17_14265 [Thiotrichaceae bacterium]|nr:hypothetical protein [Thiotrichaceae bacterium]